MKIKQFLKRYGVIIICGFFVMLSALPLALHLIYYQLNFLADSELTGGESSEAMDNYEPSDMAAAYAPSPFLLYLALFLIVFIIASTISISHAVKHDLFSRQSFTPSNIKSSECLLDEILDQEKIIQKIESSASSSIELATLSKSFLSRTNQFKWESNNQKSEFLREMLSLSPAERENVLNYMIEMDNKPLNHSL